MAYGFEISDTNGKTISSGADLRLQVFDQFSIVGINNDVNNPIVKTYPPVEGEYFSIDFTRILPTPSYWISTFHIQPVIGWFWSGNMATGSTLTVWAAFQKAALNSSQLQSSDFPSLEVQFNVYLSSVVDGGAWALPGPP